MKKLKLSSGFAIGLIAILFQACTEEPLEVQPASPEEPEAICFGCDVAPPGVIFHGSPDLIVNSVISYGRSGNVINYGVSIKNIGNDVASINYTTGRVYWQAWLSTNGVSKNVAACGQTFPAIHLQPGQITWTSINCTFPSWVNFSNYSSMIVEIYAEPGLGETRKYNNSYVRTPVP